MYTVFVTFDQLTVPAEKKIYIIVNKKKKKSFEQYCLCNCLYISPLLCILLVFLFSIWSFSLGGVVQ